MKTARTHTALAALALSLGFSATAHAETVTLDTSRLPTVQGWTYAAYGDGAAVAEASIYSVSGGLLHQNSMGVGMTQSGGNWYEHAVTLAPSENWSMTLVGRLLSFESVTSPAYPFGFCFGANDNIAVGFGSDNIQYVGRNGLASAPLPSGFDSSVFNRYELNVVGGLQSFTINGVAVFTDQLLPGGNPSAILFGDGTGYANSRADIQSFTFTSGVPEPGSWAMCLAGFGLMALALQRQRVAPRGRRCTA